jgi:hypothetical protein
MRFTYVKCLNAIDNTIRRKASEVFKQKPVDVFKRFGILCLNTFFVDKVREVHEIARPDSARTLTGPLTKPLIKVTIMAETQSTQTRPKYQYRFMALSRADKAAKPCRLSVEAFNEDEARHILAPHYILAFAARLPVLEVRHDA